MNVSISRIKLFKACRRAYQLKYIEGLEPVVKADALQTGENYHAKLEALYKTGGFDMSDLSKESAMAFAYEKYIYPKFRVKSVEDWFEYKLDWDTVLVGRTDGITEDGELVEHKTTGATSLDEYEYGLAWDEQILAYMLATGARKIWYTVIRKPNIRIKKGETDAEFFDRMVAWYAEDTESKIRLIELTRTDEEVEQFKKELHGIISSMWAADFAEEHGYYRNTCYCNAWGRRCEYSSVCLHYDPNQQYVEFEKKERS